MQNGHFYREMRNMIRIYKKAVSVIFLSLVLSCAVPAGENFTAYTANAATGEASEETAEKIYKPLRVLAKITADSLIVRTGAGKEYEQLTESGSPYSLNTGKKVYICGTEESKDGSRWYQVLFKQNNKWHKGYVTAEFVEVIASDKDKVKGILQRKCGVYARTKAVESGSILRYKGTKVSVKDSQNVHILGETTSEGIKFFKTGFYYRKKYMSGFIKADYIDFKKTEDKEAEAEKAKEEEARRAAEEAGKEQEEVAKNTEPVVPSENNNTETNPASESAVSSGTAITSQAAVSSQSSVTVNPLSEAEFEASMTEQGFPEDYKTYLRELHRLHPYWIFKAYRKGIDWESAVEAESKVGVNLVPSVKNAAWKSTENGAYDWNTGKYIVFDGSSWVTASKDAVRYYMDPRNWLNEESIYQFELLTYQPGYQTIAGVESLLSGTAMGNGAVFTYTDTQGMQVTKSYSETFMEAAAYSGVSPYHLATRSKQEVIGGYGFSSSVSGSVSGYEGLYNFYNIGAYDSANGGAVAHGLTFAKNGEIGKLYTDGIPLNDKMMIPWTDQYRAIVGGGIYIGNNYIDRGQDTVYLQKFNLTEKSRFAHQYMSNIEVGKSESEKVKAAYMNMAETPIIFSIPVFENMQTVPAPEPGTTDPLSKLDPNNYLSELSVNDYVLTPSFSPDITDYTVVTAADDVSVTIQAKAVGSKAVIAGAGEVILGAGPVNIPITVTAENGQTRTYNITFAR